MKKFWQRLVLFGLTGAFFVSCISCSAANTASKVPILMYHNLTNDPSAVTSMTITGERFQEDMEYLEYNGYTPLLSADLIDIRAGKEAMPERPVMITFDDGYRSNYDIAYPILQKTGMKAVIALIGKSIRANDNTEANRFFLKWDEAAEMADSGLVELASHTYNLHNPQYGGLTAPDGINGIQRLKGESQAAYNKRVGEDLKQSIDLITQNTNQKNVLFFAYPFGARDGWMQPLLQKNGIQVSVLTNTGTASIRRGMAAGILPKTVDVMAEQLGTKRESLIAVLGPSIRQECFETDADVPEAMEELLGAQVHPFIMEKGPKFHVDLQGIGVKLLQDAGLSAENVIDSGICTMCHSDEFWSHRVTHGVRGVQGGMICL